MMVHTVFCQSRILRAMFIAQLAIVVTLVLSPCTYAQRVTSADYRQAEKYSNENLRPFVYSMTVTPNWIGKTDVFWYSFETNQGTRYYRVDPEKRTKEPLFDHVKLAGQLSELMRKPQHSSRLPLSRVSVDDNGVKMKFVADQYQYEYDLKTEKLAKLGKAPAAPAGGRGGRGGFGRGNNEQLQKFLEERRRQLEEEQEDEKNDQKKDTQKKDDNEQKKDFGRGGRGRGGRGGGGRGGFGGLGGDRAWSPDKKMYVYAQKHNLFISTSDKDAVPVKLTTDGEKDYSFGGGDNDRKARPAVTWSKNSEAFYVTRRDSRGVKELFLVDSLAQPRPKLEQYAYPMPGEENIRKTELFVYHKNSGKLKRITPKWKDESYSNIHWDEKTGELRFVRVDRLLRNIEVCRLDPKTGEAKCMIAEGFDNSTISYQPIEYIDETGEMIWWSERSGWGHYYLMDHDGKLKNCITPGAFRASKIVKVDPEKRLLYFTGNGREPGENIYYNHLYCVHLDGTNLTLLDPGNADHRSFLSPSRQYIVDTCSRVDMAPVSVLRDATGNQIMELERADLSKLYEMGWQMPETFTVKAADGVTDLYGNMWKPFNFDPNKKYPIIAHVYPGPQQEGVSHTFSALRGEVALAQLGFIVIQVGHRGGTPTRDKAYQSFSYFNLRDYALPDTKFAIEQLAARNSYFDIDRVGIYGHSGGGFMSAAALLQKPYNEFFKAAVASAGNHDNNIYNNTWSERYHGMKEVVIADDEKDGSRSKKGTTRTVTTSADEEEQESQEKGSQEGGKKEGQEGEKKVTGDGGKKDGQDSQKKDQKKETEETTKVKTKFEIRVPTNAELAENLKGALLLVHGEIDNNVHPANTMRLVNALIKANKRFEMLIIPGARHGFGQYQPYFNRRMWEFFAVNLMGDRPLGVNMTPEQ